MQAVHLAVCFQNLQDSAIKSRLLLSLCVYFILHSLLCMNIYEHVQAFDPQEVRLPLSLFIHATADINFRLDVTSSPNFHIEDNCSVGNAWNIETSPHIISESSSPPHLRPCKRLYHSTGCCHRQCNCHRELQTICTGHNRDKEHCHQFLNYFHPNISTWVCTERQKGKEATNSEMFGSW